MAAVSWWLTISLLETCADITRRTWSSQTAPIRRPSLRRKVSAIGSKLPLRQGRKPLGVQGVFKFELAGKSWERSNKVGGFSLSLLCGIVYMRLSPAISKAIELTTKISTNSISTCPFFYWMKEKLHVVVLEWVIRIYLHKNSFFNQKIFYSSYHDTTFSVHLPTTCSSYIQNKTQAFCSLSQFRLLSSMKVVYSPQLRLLYVSSAIPLLKIIWNMATTAFPVVHLVSNVLPKSVIFWLPC